MTCGPDIQHTYGTWSVGEEAWQAMGSQICPEGQVVPSRLWGRYTHGVQGQKDGAKLGHWEVTFPHCPYLGTILKGFLGALPGLSCREISPIIRMTLRASSTPRGLKTLFCMYECLVHICIYVNHMCA